MLVERFKKYLEQQFRLIAPTKEAMEYRQEVLTNLLDRALEYRIKGMTDDDAIFDLCIDSLGDFKSTLKDFESRLENIKKAAPKASAFALAGIAIALFVVIGYLTASFATNDWARTWLILVGGVFAGVITAAIFLIVKLSKKKKFLAVRGLSHVILVLLFVMAFLILQIVVRYHYSWMTFLVMVVALLISDTALAYAFNSKLKLISLLAAVEVTAVMVYVILGVAGVISWHPYWLIPVGAVIVDLGILIGTLKRFSQKREEAALIEKENLNEDYYTMWKE